MLKMIKFLFVICVLFYSSDYEFVYAKNKENVVYAKVLENCNLYKSKDMRKCVLCNFCKSHRLPPHIVRNSAVTLI